MMSSEEFKCVFCKESFTNKESLQIHFRKHGDKNFHLKKSRSQDEPSELPEKATSVKDQVEMVECDVCPEVFTSISKAITHKHKVHPDHDAKHFCPWCGKLFTMKHLYTKHMNTTHVNVERTEKNFSCDVCAVQFHLPTAMSYHNKFFHRIYEMPSIGNSKKLKMFNQEAVQIYYCPFCGEEYDNKINLHKHMGDDHHDENQNPDDVLRCPVCEAVFFHLDAYELHLTYHSVDDMYSERNAIMDEVTDFSLETVPPLAERVESVESQDNGSATGIEQLFELTMDDTKLKKKKHKKHKKSKKSAITLDQFLNMNTDVFGEGLDFQGIEEVPTQTITKRLKKPIKRPTQAKLPPDIEKLKRQGIVIKKKPGPVKHVAVNPKPPSKAIPSSTSQSKPLATNNALLTKLINQNNSQIKIVKKSTLETINTNETGDIKEDSPATNKEPVENAVPNEKKIIGTVLKENKDMIEDNPTTDAETKTDEDIPSNKNANSENNTSICTENDEESNHSQSILNENIEDEVPQTKPKTDDHITSLRNNSNILVKSSQIIPDINKNKKSTTQDSDDNMSNNDDTDMEDAELNLNKKNESLNVLKHLSHLIVKPCSQDIKPTKLGNTQEINKKVDSPAVSKIAHLIRNSPAKTVSNIIKSSNSSPQSNTPLQIKTVETEESNFDSEDVSDEQRDKTIAEPVHSKLASILNNPHLNIQAIKKSPQILPEKETNSENINKTEKTNNDLQKLIKNLSAKPVSVNMSTSSPKGSPKILNTIKKEPATPVKVTKVIQEDIEIFKIDDSDSDEATSNNLQTKKNNEIPTPSKTKSQEMPTPNKSAEVLKNINKNITIKSTNNKLQNKVNKVKVEEFYSDNDESNDAIHDTPLLNIPNRKISSAPSNQKQSTLNNVLKNLSKNITIKSGNSPLTMSEDHKSQDSDYTQNDEEIDSDTDSISSRVKITEMKEGSDEELHKDESGDVQDNVKVQYPEEDSDNEDINDNDEFQNFSDDDIETHIPASTVKNISTPKSNLENLKNVCKDLVIKPTGSQAMNRTQKPPTSDEIPPFAKSLSNKIATTNMKSDKLRTNTANFRNTNQSVGSMVNKSSINRMASTSNQVNTVNKEVKTVKTIQSQTETQTVIEEITTTVTKTIKTVNQSMKQEVRNTGPSTSMPQKIQHLNANNKNFQGVKVRQSCPMPTGPRVRNPGMRPTRPALPAPIRANNQLVAVRPRLNSPRPSNPRMPVIRPSTSNQTRPQIGKVAPGVSLASGKRPNTEAPGHFSCFKKTKESLFPDDLSANKHDGETSVQFSSTMQMSKSNFASSTKTVKGNSVVMSTQMKSEMSASSQQLGKLRNLSGLSVVKTSQTNASHVEEKNERSAANQNTLDAIQKLQSQGLLVKKPRIVTEESEHSNSGSDNMNNFSDEESGA